MGQARPVLDEMNELFLAIVTMFSAAAGPATTYPYQSWVDTDLSPPAWFIRNAENTAWIKVAEFLNNPTNQIRFFHEGARAVGAAVANVFTATQTIDRAGAAGEVAIGSDRNSGAAALLRMFGHNASNADFDGLRVQMDVTDGAASSEDVTVIVQTMQGGTIETLISMAAAVLTITGTLNATTLQQGGTPVNTLINNAVKALATSRTVSGAFTIAQTDEGKAIKFDGTTAVNVTCGRLALDTIITIHNIGTADLTLVSAAASNGRHLPERHQDRRRQDGQPDHGQDRRCRRRQHLAGPRRKFVIPSMAAFMAGGFTPIRVLDALADSGGTDESLNPGSFPVSAGSKRLLLAAMHMTGSSDTITGLSWGGQPMTQRVTVTSAGGFPAVVRIWTLLESGIVAASGTAFGVTGLINGSYRCTAVTLENVHQSNPIVDTGSGAESGGNPADVVLNTVAGGYAMAALMLDHAVTNDILWGSDFTERVDEETSATGNTWSAADTLTDGTDVTADPTTNRNTNQQCQAAISIRPA